MSTIPLPARPSMEQLRKQAKDLLRGLRTGQPDALALAAEHNPGAVDALTLDSAQLVVARRYGYTSWPRLADRVRSLAQPPESGALVRLTMTDHYRVRTGWVSEEDIERCARVATGAHPDPTRWRPLCTAHHNGMRVIVCTTPAGLLFGELTPTTVTLSEPTRLDARTGRARLLWHTALGTLAGVVPDGTRSLSLERPGDLRARAGTVIVDGIFLAPNAFLVTSTGLMCRADDSMTADIVPADTLPARSFGVVDRPAPPADRSSAAGQLLGQAIAAADAPPVIDADQWVPGVHTELGAERFQLGRYGDLLTVYRTGARRHEGLSVIDFGPRQGPFQWFRIAGDMLAATRMHYDFVDGGSDTTALIGLVDDRVASATLHRRGWPDTRASIAAGTFVVAGPALRGLPDNGDDEATVFVHDAEGNLIERLPYVRSRRPAR